MFLPTDIVSGGVMRACVFFKILFIFSPTILLDGGPIYEKNSTAGFLLALFWDVYC